MTSSKNAYTTASRSHQFQEAIESGTETGHNPETPGHRRDLHGYTSLQYQWLDGRTTICKFIPHVCRVILAEFQDEYFHCPDSPDEWKGCWRCSEQGGWAVDRKHITMMKPKKTGNDYYNYNGSPDPGRRRIQIPVDRLWVKWFMLRCTTFSTEAF